MPVKRLRLTPQQNELKQLCAEVLHKSQLRPIAAKYLGGRQFRVVITLEGWRQTKAVDYRIIAAFAGYEVVVIYVIV
jgi:hypothetical protein